MPITILNPQPAPQRPLTAIVADAGPDSDTIEGVDVSMEDEEDDGAINEILTPGTIITSDPKWMR